MLDLSRVTCFAIDNTNRIEETINALHTCKNVANFGEVKLVTTPNYVNKYKDECAIDGILVQEQVKPLTNIDEYNYYILYHLHKHIDTEFCLLVQDHAFIINPDAWREEFFSYDYIGAPWPIRDRAYITPYGEHQRVGNGGFCIRSRKFLEFSSQFKDTGILGEDTFLCTKMYQEAIDYGIKFAPFELAIKFAYENPCFEYDGHHWDELIAFDPSKHFGWHGSQFANKNELLSLKYR